MKARSSASPSSNQRKLNKVERLALPLTASLAVNMAMTLAAALPNSLTSNGITCAAASANDLNKQSLDSQMTDLEKRARTLKQEKNYKELEPLARQRLNIYRGQYNDGNLVYAIDELADTLLALGKLDEAETLYKESLKINKEVSHVWGKPVPNYQTRDLARQLTGLGHVAMKKGDLKTAELYFREYFDGVKKEERGLRVIHTPQATLELAECLLAQRKDSEALNLLKEASQLNVNAHAFYSQAALLNKLADQLEKSGEKSQAAQYRSIASSLKKHQEEMNKSGLDY